MVKQTGAKYGLGDYASKITADANGHLSVKDPATRHAILALRNDPQVSAEMAGELDKANAASLKQNVGGKIGGTELYLAHFLGASGASDFINEMRSNPKATGESVLPGAAAANPSVFYTKSGEPRSLQQIYQHFAQKFDGNSTVQIANAVASPVATSSPTYTVASATSTPLALPASYSSVTTGSSTISPTTSSTLYTAMVLGQNGADLNLNSSLSAFTQADRHRHSVMGSLSAVG